MCKNDKSNDLISRSELKKVFSTWNDLTFVPVMRERALKLIDNAPTVERPQGNWHSLKDNPNDLPTKTAWYVCKVKSSDDLHLVFGYEEVTSDRFDAWQEVII